MTTYKSELKTISSSEEVVFALLSDLNNLQQLSDKPIPTDKIRDLIFDTTSCSFIVDGFGRIGFRIAELIPTTLIKFESEQAPVEMNAIVNLSKLNENETGFQLTINAQLPTMIKMMVDKKLKEGVEKIAEVVVKVLSKK